MRKAFTLIELLVVISIIGLLASVVFSSLNTARAKARSVRRIEDLHTLRQVVELYYASNGQYPIPSNTAVFYYDCYSAGGANDFNNYIPNVVTDGIIARLPHDPNTTGCTGDGSGQYNYAYRSDGTDYKIIAPTIPNARIENCDYGKKLGFEDPVRFCGRVGGDDAWAVYTPGAAGW